MKSFRVAIFAVAILFMMIIPSFGSEAGNFPGQALEGYIKSISDTGVEVEEYTGHVRKFSFALNTIFRIDDTPASIKDFKPGMEIYAKRAGTRLSYMESYSTENPGYIPPGGKVRSGVIKKIDRDQLILQLPTGKAESYFYTPATIIVKNGQNVPASTLYEGDNVRLYFNDKDTTIVSRLHIQSDSVNIKDLYRGILDGTNTLDDALVLRNVEVFRNGLWREYKDTIRIDHTQDLPFYIAGQSIAAKDLRYYRGKTVYMAIKDFFGKDKIEKLVLKNQYETTFSDKIEDINWYAEAFELRNKQNVSFNDGTIFIKSNRLVDKFSINPGSDAFVVADGRGGKLTADVVYIYNEDINNSNIGQNYLYAGKLHEVVENKLILRDFFILNKNEWESFDDDKELYYDNDTYIYDLEDGKRITPEAFFAMDYAIDRDSRSGRRRRDLRSWHSYAYTDGDRVVAIALQEDMDSILKQRITIGNVEKIEGDSLVGKIITVRDAKDWSSRNDKWMAKTIPVRMQVENALIVKGDRVISLEELKPGDTIYSVRDDFYGRFILVK